MWDLPLFQWMTVSTHLLYLQTVPCSSRVESWFQITTTQLAKQQLFFLPVTTIFQFFFNRSIKHLWSERPSKGAFFEYSISLYMLCSDPFYSDNLMLTSGISFATFVNRCEEFTKVLAVRFETFIQTEHAIVKNSCVADRTIWDRLLPVPMRPGGIYIYTLSLFAILINSVILQ